MLNLFLPFVKCLLKFRQKMKKYIIVLFHCFEFKAIIKMQKIMEEEMTKFSHIDILIGRVLYEFLETTNDKGISCISKITSTAEKVFISKPLKNWIMLFKYKNILISLLRLKLHSVSKILIFEQSSCWDFVHLLFPTVHANDHHLLGHARRIIIIYFINPF